ncbi:SPOR domain-containing protein [Azospirillum rugosum]|uniref:SPOR domain-containing protein n=1 Tax=Azospirillum rugosum TaxID=416170 RepID=A0ABS4SDZ9_9PROT|nr:SPOR domain-containing protein [Azospirillum rugosum]MBP2290805.1 hypothetical protein [Azospirillum rugosum]MDQ0529672.1 hypothetical protein [Azospirillum rugosum]
MKYEGDVNYASNPYGTAPNRGGRRGLLGLGMAVVGIVAFAGAIVVTYGKGDRASSDGGPPLLTADGAPTKMRPEQPGGMEVPHQDKLVYERLNEHAAKPTVERLLPPPEEPLPRPVVTPQMPPPPAMPEVPAVAQLPPPPPGSTTTVPRLPDGQPAAGAEGQPVAPPPAVAAVPPATAPVAKAAPAVKPAPSTAAQPQPNAQQPGAPKAAPAAPVQTAALPSPPKPAPAPAAQTPAPQAAKPAPTPAAAPPAPAKAAGGGGGWRIQLASLRSEAEATAEWKRLSGRHPDALGGLSMQVVKADLGEKGVYYRVQGVGLNEDRAKAACAQLKAQSVGCVVVRP